MCVCVCVCALETHILYRLKAFPIFISVVSVSSGMGKIRGNIYKLQIVTLQFFD